MYDTRLHTPRGKHNVTTTVCTPSQQPTSYSSGSKGISIPKCVPQTHEAKNIKLVSINRNQRLDWGCKASNRHPPNTLQMLSLAFLLHECETTVGWHCSRQDSGFANIWPLNTVTPVSPEHRSESLAFKFSSSDPHFPPCDLFTHTPKATLLFLQLPCLSQRVLRRAHCFTAYVRSGALRKDACCIPIISSYDGHRGPDFFLPVETKAIYEGKGLVSAHSLKDSPSRQASVMSRRV